MALDLSQLDPYLDNPEDSPEEKERKKLERLNVLSGLLSPQTKEPMMSEMSPEQMESIGQPQPPIPAVPKRPVSAEPPIPEIETPNKNMMQGLPDATAITKALQGQTAPAAPMPEAAMPEMSPQQAPQEDSELTRYKSLIDQYGSMLGEDKELEQSLADRRQQLQRLALMKGAAQIGAGLIGVGAKAKIDPNLQAFEPLEKLAELGVQDVKEKRAGKKEKLQQFLDLSKAKQEAERVGRESKQFGLTQKKLQQDIDANEIKLGAETTRHDPNSPVSQLGYQILEKYNIKAPPGMSANDIDGYLKTLSTANSMTANLEYKRAMLDFYRDSLGEKKEARYLREEQHNWRKKEKDELSDKQVEGIASFDKVGVLLDNILGQKGKQDTGRLSSIQNTLAQWVGMDDAKKSSFRADVVDSLSQYIKSLSGLTVSDTERDNLLKASPRMEDNDSTFMEKLLAMQKRLQLMKQTELDAINRQGKNIDTFESKEEYDNSTLVVRNPRGQEGRMTRKQFNDAVRANAGYTFVREDK